jgi:SAM-dependent methyltransferase
MRASLTMASDGQPLQRLLGAPRRALRRARWALEDRRLSAEQRRGALGSAHLGWSDNSAARNKERWDGWDWSHGGEEWNVSAEWKQALIDDVLRRWIPQDAAVLEIGPGGGRWSEPLLERASRLVLADVSERPLELCRERFAGAGKVEYVLTSGGDLAGVGDASIDAVWSFDVFVHIAPADQASYLAEIARVLVPGGIAVIHHADGRNRGVHPSRAGWRAPMSRELFKSLAGQRGLVVDSQIDSWGDGGRYDLSGYGDVITVCRRRAAV